MSWLTRDNIEMTSSFSRMPLLLYTRVLQHAQQSTKKEKQQVNNNNAGNKAVLLLGFADFCLMFVVINHRLLTS